MFLGLSYFLRFLDGASDAASWGAVLGILMKIWPDRVATIMSWTEMFFGLGYTIGQFGLCTDAPGKAHQSCHKRGVGSVLGTARSKMAAKNYRDRRLVG